MKKTKGQEFIRFFHPIISILWESGATATPGEIVDRSIELAGVSEQEQQAVNNNGQSRVRNQVHWAR
jgi:restriction system protein